MPCANAEIVWQQRMIYNLRQVSLLMNTKSKIEQLTLLQYKEEQFQLRTPTLHDYHCTLLTGPLQEHNSTTYGVNFHSPLNDIAHFHVANWQIPQDVMHVVLEGVLKQGIQMLLQVLIVENQLFTLPVLNNRLQSFQYEYSEVSSKPTLIEAHGLISNDPSSIHQNGKFL